MPIESPVGPLSTLEEMVARARTLSGPLEQHFREPVLLVVAPSEEWAAVNAPTQVSLSDTGEVKQAASVTMLPTLVVPFDRSRMLESPRLSLGRAAQCDVILPFAAVSKLHGHFLASAAGAWSFEDAGSQNGTAIDGVRLDAGHPAPLRNRALLRFGDVTARFLEPAAFCEDLRRRLGMAKAN